MNLVEKIHYIEHVAHIYLIRSVIREHKMGNIDLVPILELHQTEVTAVHVIYCFAIHNEAEGCQQAPEKNNSRFLHQ